MTGTISPGAHALEARRNRIRRIEELECTVQDLNAAVDDLEAQVERLGAEKAELQRQLDLAKSDIICERPMSMPGFNHHQGGTE